MSTSRADVSDALFSVAALIARLENEHLASLEHGLSPPQFRLLRRVAIGQTSPTRIRSSGTTITLAAISQGLDLLVQRGFLTRRRDADDGRRVVFVLTDAGQQALDAAESSLAALGDALLVGLSASELQELQRTIEDIRSRVVDRLDPNMAGDGDRPGVRR